MYSVLYSTYYRTYSTPYMPETLFITVRTEYYSAPYMGHALSRHLQQPLARIALARCHFNFFYSTSSKAACRDRFEPFKLYYSLTSPIHSRDLMSGLGDDKGHCNGDSSALPAALSLQHSNIATLETSSRYTSAAHNK